MQRKDDGGRENEVKSTAMERIARGSDKERRKCIQTPSHDRGTDSSAYTNITVCVSLFVPLCLPCSECAIHISLVPGRKVKHSSPPFASSL